MCLCAGSLGQASGCLGQHVFQLSTTNLCRPARPTAEGAVAPACTALLACHHCSAAWAVLAGGAGADEVIGALLVAAGVGGASAEAALVAGLVAALLVLGGATGEARGAACRDERQQAARAQGREQVRMSRGGKGKGADRHRLRRSSTAHPLGRTPVGKPAGPPLTVGLDQELAVDSLLGHGAHRGAAAAAAGGQRGG